MPKATANGIQLEYDTFGDAAASPLLLVMGLGAQMIAWDEEFCSLIADKGHHVIRFDNRDVGLSTRIESGGVPNIPAIMEARAKGEPVSAPYLLADMAADAAGLLDALGIAKAHIVGASMGGMIVQEMAVRHTDRVLSMTSIMSTTGAPDLPAAKPEAMAALTTPAPADREGFIAHTVKTSKLIGSAPHLIDEERLTRLAGLRFDRAYYPVGIARQMAAIMASGSRREALGAVRAPTTVIHGAIDPLVPVEGGIDTHKSVAGSELIVIDDMGHDLPAPLWGRIADAIAATASRARVPA
jgi:pimeloyl-ACP methyl ester carboxylesterase